MVVCHCAVRIDVYRQGLKFQKGEKVNPKTGNTEPVWERLQNFGKTLRDYLVTSETELLIKDIGPQFSYRGVFFWEYFGPIAIVAFLATRPSFIYGEGASEKPLSDVAMLGAIAWVLHYAKREFETFFVHKFSRPTMPLSNLFKNCTYYWGFAAAIGYVLCHPDYTPQSERVAHIAAGVMLVSELLNGVVHWQLANMRPKVRAGKSLRSSHTFRSYLCSFRSMSCALQEGSDKRLPPSGGFFDLVSCPNYTFEVMSWIAFAFLTNIAVVWCFVLLGLAQMAQWALQKHRGYKAQQPGLRRAAIIPFLL